MHLGARQVKSESSSYYTNTKQPPFGVYAVLVRSCAAGKIEPPEKVVKNLITPWRSIGAYPNYRAKFPRSRARCRYGTQRKLTALLARQS